MSTRPLPDACGNALAILIGLMLAVILTIVIDRTFGWITNTKVGNSSFFPKSDDPDGLGWSARNEGKSINKGTSHSMPHKVVVGGEVIFDVTYNFDYLYRREVVSTPKGALDKFAIFFGDSQTFGEGLEDSDTIPSLVQARAPDYRVYNYAYKGYGPHQMLKKLQTNTLLDEVREEQGIAFFQYFGFHLQRVTGMLSYIRWAGGGAPYYALNSNGLLEYRGSFSTGRFFTTMFYWLLSKSAIATYYQVELPQDNEDAHRALVCKVIAESRDVFVRAYPRSRFVVIVGMTTADHDPIVESCLQGHGISFLDMRGSEVGKEGLTFPHDGHFTPKAARLIAAHLAPLLAGE